MLKAVLVDDEAPARDRLQRLLKKIGGVEITGFAKNGLEALEVIHSARPDVVFLDVEMPELDGFGVAKELGDTGPAIVFVTAYDEFALQAFEVSAVDYIVKPVSEQRLGATIRKLASKKSAPSGLEPLLMAVEARNPRPKLAIRLGNKYVAYDAAQVSAVIARDHYSAVIVNGRELLTDDPLDLMEKKLDSRNFVRVHRGAIINLGFLKELEREGDRKYTAVLSDGPATGQGTRVQVSRERLPTLKSRLGIE